MNQSPVYISFSSDRNTEITLQWLTLYIYIHTHTHRLTLFIKEINSPVRQPSSENKSFNTKGQTSGYPCRRGPLFVAADLRSQWPQWWSAKHQQQLLAQQGSDQILMTIWAPVLVQHQLVPHQAVQSKCILKFIKATMDKGYAILQYDIISYVARNLWIIMHD